MPAPSPQSSVLLLERGQIEAGAATSGPFAVPGSAPAPTRRVVARESLFRAPGLAVLAACSVLEAYRWFGVIPNSASRPWAVAFAVVAVVAALALTRTTPGVARTPVQRLVIMATGLVLWNHEGWTNAVIGIAELGLAAAALVDLVLVERSRQRGNVPA